MSSDKNGVPCPNCGDVHDDAPTQEMVDRRHTMFNRKYDNFVDDLTMAGLVEAGDKFNKIDYLAYVVGAILRLADKADESLEELASELLGKQEGEGMALEVKKAVITKLLLDELGEHTFIREL